MWKRIAAVLGRDRRVLTLNRFRAGACARRPVHLRSRTCAAYAAALLLSSASALQSSDTTYVSQGDRVRVSFWHPQQVGSVRVQQVGSVRMLGADTLVILPEHANAELWIPRSHLDEVLVYREESNWLLGGIVGGAVGFVAGGILGAVSAGVCDSGDCLEVGEGVVVGAFLGGAALFGAGAGIGALIKSERWERAELSSRTPGVSLGLGKDGAVRLALSLRL